MQTGRKKNKTKAKVKTERKIKKDTKRERGPNALIEIPDNRSKEMELRKIIEAQNMRI
jgi:hypothetical protein